MIVCQKLTRSQLSRKAKNLRQKLFKNQGGKCYYCGKSCFNFKLINGNEDPKIRHPRRASLEHVIPKVRKRKIDCFVMCCQECNEERGSKKLKKFLDSKRNDQTQKMKQLLSSKFFNSGELQIMSIIDI